MIGARFVDKLKELLEREYQNLSLWYFVSFLFGCAFCFSKNDAITWDYVRVVCLILLCSLCCCYLSFKKHLFWRFSILLLLSATVGAGIGALKKSQIKTSLISKHLCTLIQGDVEQIKKTTRGMQVLLSNIHSPNELISKTNSNIRINIKDKYFINFKAGDRIEIRACLMPPPTKVIPNGYDFNFYANLSNISSVGYGISKPIIVHQNDSIWPKWQEKIYKRLSSNLNQVSANFIAALIIGNNKGIDDKVMKNMRLTGMSHILCISGLHLSLVTLICFKSLRFLLNASDYLAHNVNIKIIAGIISIIFSYCYLKLSGSQVAATRAFVMCALATLAIMLQRNYSPIRAVALASFVILIYDPEYSLHPSFQLSFLAVLSLIIGYNFYLSHFGKSDKIKSFFGKIKGYIISNLYTSTLVSFATGPVVIYHFHIFSNYSSLANLIAVPITTFILMPGCFIFLLTAPLNLDSYVLRVMDYFINIIIKSAALIAEMPYSFIHVGNISSSSFTTYLLGFFWCIIWQSKIKYLGVIIIGISVLMMLSVKNPDLILDIDLQAIGLQNKQNKLEIYANKYFSMFTKEYWSLWFGQKEVLYQELKKKDQNLSFATRQNKIIDIIFKDVDCNDLRADLVINYTNKICDNQKMLNIKDIPDKKFIFVFCSQDYCFAKSYN
jgi:competence protein ComEC